MAGVWRRIKAMPTSAHRRALRKEEQGNYSDRGVPQVLSPMPMFFSLIHVGDVLICLQSFSCTLYCVVPPTQESWSCTRGSAAKWRAPLLASAHRTASYEQDWVAGQVPGQGVEQGKARCT